MDVTDVLLEDCTHLCPYSLRNSPWKTKTDGARTSAHYRHFVSWGKTSVWGHMDLTQKHRNIYCIELMFGLCWHSAVQWQVQLSDPHDTLQGVSHCQKRRPWKLQWLCTKTHEKPKAASCLNAVLHEAVKYRRAGLKSCRWWWGHSVRFPWALLCSLSHTHFNFIATAT